MIELILPFPPSVNNYKKVGRMVLTKNNKLYQQRVNTNETKMFYYKVWMRIKPKLPREGTIFGDSATIACEIDLHPPHSNKRWDADNRLKVLLDSLTNAKVWDDDSQVTRLVVQKMAMIPQGQTVVRIYEL